MLFKSRFHAGIRSGAVTCTVRAWSRSQAIAGNEYAFDRTGRIRVDAVDSVPLGDLDESHARRSGFESVEELVRMLRSASKRKLTKRSKLFLIRFIYLGERRDPSPRLSTEDLRRRLERMGGWSFELLREIGRRPGVSSALLAETLGSERAKLKANVRKLKRLGLTKSLEVGYELTPAGRELTR